MGRLSKILKPFFDKGNFEDNFSAWEDEVHKYEKETATSLSDSVKIAVLMNETKGHLQEHLRLNCTKITVYTQVKDIILKYFRTQVFTSKETEAMDISWVGKGKGKGKHNGKRQGERQRQR